MVFASEEGYLETVKILVKRGVDVHAGGDEALVGASRGGHLEVVQFLIEAGPAGRIPWLTAGAPAVV